MLKMMERIANELIGYEEAAEQLGVCRKTVERNFDKFLQEGAMGLRHKSRGRAAYNKTAPALTDRIVDLYETKYTGFNFTHFTQKVVEKERIQLSYPTIYTTLTEAGIQSPKCRKVRREVVFHPCRNRRGRFGELVQIDGSPHQWFGNEITTLHLGIDDATSTIVGGYFEQQETLHGYYGLFKQILMNHGVPEEFYTDKRTVFTSKYHPNVKLEAERGTQFQMAAAKLGVKKIHTSSVPQAKGRIERANGTFQDRLISEMRLAKITTIEQANAFLPWFIDDHNKRYALDSSCLDNAFRPAPDEQTIDIMLSVVCERMVNNGNIIRYKEKMYAIFDGKSRKLIKPRTKVYVLKTLDNRLLVLHKEDVYNLVALQTMTLPIPEDLKDKIYIPPKDHPWKEASYTMMLNKLRRVA